MNKAMRDRLLATTIIAGAALAATPDFAQTAPAATPAPDVASQTAAPSGAPNEIIVTGSRIPQPNLTSAAPVTVVTGQDLKLQGTTRVEDLLNTLPQVSAGQASGLSNGASGTATVDLRGLGPTRTLVLINGRRLLPGDPSSTSGGEADLNAIPASLVKRVEVLTGGASATYGADAVAGVVNFVMDTDFTGFKVDGQYSLFQHDNRNSLLPGLLDARTAAGQPGFGYPTGNSADGGTIDTTVTMGAGFDDNRGHIVGYFGYRKVNAVLEGNRDYSACTLQVVAATGAPQCGGSAVANPANAVIYNGGTSTVFTVAPGGKLVNGANRYNFAPTNYFQRPDERYTAGFFAHYDVSEAIKPYMEFNFMDDHTEAQIAPSGDFGNTLVTNCDNPYLISTGNEALVCAPENQVNGFLGNFPLTPTSNPGAAPVNFIDPTTGATYNKAFLQLLRRNTEGGGRVADLEHTQYRGVVGVKGDVGTAWSYDAYYQYGRTVYSQIYRNEFSVSRLGNALDVVAGPGGVPECRSVETGSDLTCVPYNFLGTPSQAAIDYVSATGFQKGTVSEQVADASITGRLGEYGIKTPWATEGLGVNFGAEYRKESLDLETDQEFQTGDLTGQGGPTKPISGNYDVKELFAEAQLPVVHEGFVYDLSLQAGYRYSDYKVSNGNHYTTNTYKFGAEFAPIRDIRFRGSYNRAVRAPNIQELFAPDIVVLDGSKDPCAGFVIAATDTGCLAQGLHVGQRVAANPAGQYNGLTGGTGSLKPEIATTKTFGIVLEPRFLPHFNLTVDYYDIKVKGAIQSFGADAIVTTCTTTSDPLACGLVHRNPVSGSLWLTPDGYVQDLSQNIGSVHTKGIDVSANYQQDIGNFGSLGFSVNGTYLKEFRIDNGLSAPYDCAGLYGTTCSGSTTTPAAPNPKWRHRARLTWTAPNGLGLSLQWRYFGKVRVDASTDNSTLAGTFYNPGAKIAAQSYFDLVGTAKIGDHYTFRLGVDNLLDRQPPLVTSGDPNGSGSACPTGPCNGNTYPAVYDALGRYIFMGVSLDF